MPDPIARLSRGISRVVLIVAAAGLVAMTLIISWQVFSRYVLEASAAWTEQAALLLMIWFIFLATAVGIREGFHISITAMIEPLGPGATRTAIIATHVIVGIIGVGMVVWGAELTGYTWGISIPTLGISRGYAYVPIVISGALIVFFAVEHVVTRARGGEVKPLWN